MGLLLDYVKRGWSVFPACVPIRIKYCIHHGKCESAGKTPLVSWKQFQDRIPTEKEAAGWERQFPDHNIAFVTGKINNVVILDQDGLEGKEYVEHMGLDLGPRILTGKPYGVHYWMKNPEHEVRNFTKRHGLDFRGDGGYCCIPSSLHELGTKYRWVEGTENLEPVDMPEWLSSFFIEQEKIKINTNEHGWIAKALIDLREGNRNDSLHKIAGFLRRFNCTYDDIMVLLKPHAMSVGLEVKELDIIVRSACRYVPDYQITMTKRDNMRLDIEDGNYYWIKEN